MTDIELHLLVQSKCHMVPLYDTIEEYSKIYRELKKQEEKK